VERLRLASDDRVAIPVPIFHMFGLGAAFLPAVAVEASIDLQKGANLLRYLQRERAFNPNMVFLTPVFCETLLKGRKSSRTYKLTVAAGDRVRAKTFSRYESLFGNFVQLYGSTEMGAITASNPEDSSDLRSKTVGKPMSNVKMRITSKSDKPDGETKDSGELWCYHDYGFEGYVDEYGKPINSHEVLRDGWFCTKDLGRIWSEGRIEVLGRSDHSVNRDGLLVFFSDVEKAIEKMEEIDSSVVVSKGESSRGKGLVAYCIPAKGVEFNEKDIRDYCFNQLPRRSVPDIIKIADALPQLPNGKVDRQTLISNTEAVTPEG